MSIHAVKSYQSEVEQIIQFGGSSKEGSISIEFQRLVNEYAKGRGLRLIPQASMRTAKGKLIQPDGTLRDSMQLDWGHWESKDEADDIDEEIQKKFSKDYPKDNILFEDSRTAILIQHGAEVARVSMADAHALDGTIRRFVEYEPAYVKTFREAIERFRQDIPKVTETIKELIAQQERNPKFVKARTEFLKLAKEAINKDVNEEDVREMMIQHILTADIFNTIFDEPHFHRENNVAKELERVVDTFFTGPLRRATLERVKHYYDVINARAASIADHHEKQKFLKVVYEAFYKSYNPKAADRLGVVYTPTEIVRFMIESTDYLLEKYFGKGLSDKGVEILDPATGTGTFICDIIDHIRKDKLAYKYEHELHANEVAILPYYISNLNIEFTYKQKMGVYAEFENLCFVDTLDNLGFKRSRQNDLFNPFTEENSKRIMRQNSKKIAVVIGNPPYNANQQNENDNNKNRTYEEIDARIKETFIKQSTAQKTKVYDMYARFYRWAFDRLDVNGIVAFITNRSFIDSRTFDGFRKTVQTEFDAAYIIDTKSDVRANPKISGTGHNVFGIQTGVAVMLLVRKEGKTKNAKKNCQIQYTALDDFMRRDDKLAWFNEAKLEALGFERVTPDKGNNWIGVEDNDWESLLPVASKAVKQGKEEKAIFKAFSLGAVTNRDEWVYDVSSRNLEKKVKYFINTFNSEMVRWNGSSRLQRINDFVDRSIKWTEELEAHLVKGSKLSFNEARIRKAHYRPFSVRKTYFDKIITHRPYQNDMVWGIDKVLTNAVITLTIHPQAELLFFCSNFLVDQGFGSRATTILPLYRYENGTRTDNITEWGLAQFQKKYGKKGITKEGVFHYIYAVLHNPAYRTKYALNLKREFPRIPLYKDFKLWAEWGRVLMDLHLNYEKAAPYPLERGEIVIDLAAGANPDSLLKGKLKADRIKGEIIIDAYTTLYGIPPEAWEYKLGNRSAIEWILDQYKESTPKDPTIAEKFNTYRFADYKEQVIDLIMRVCTVSVETMKIVELMNGLLPSS